MKSSHGGKPEEIAVLPPEDDTGPLLAGPGGSVLVLTVPCHEWEGTPVGTYRQIDDAAFDLAAARWPTEKLACGPEVRFDESGNAYGVTECGVVRSTPTQETRVVITMEEIKRVSKDHVLLLGAAEPGIVLLCFFRSFSCDDVYRSDSDGRLSLIYQETQYEDGVRDYILDAAWLPNGDVVILADRKKELGIGSVLLLSKSEGSSFATTEEQKAGCRDWAYAYPCPFLLLEMPEGQLPPEIEADGWELYVVVDRRGESFEPFAPSRVTGLLVYHLS